MPHWPGGVKAFESRPYMKERGCVCRFCVCADSRTGAAGGENQRTRNGYCCTR
jgi:hypothetical protein